MKKLFKTNNHGYFDSQTKNKKIVNIKKLQYYSTHFIWITVLIKVNVLCLNAFNTSML